MEVALEKYSHKGSRVKTKIDIALNVLIVTTLCIVILTLITYPILWGFFYLGGHISIAYILFYGVPIILVSSIILKLWMPRTYNKLILHQETINIVSSVSTLNLSVSIADITNIKYIESKHLLAITISDKQVLMTGYESMYSFYVELKKVIDKTKKQRFLS